MLETCITKYFFHFDDKRLDGQIGLTSKLHVLLSPHKITLVQIIWLAVVTGKPYVLLRETCGHSLGFNEVSVFHVASKPLESKKFLRESILL